MAAAKHELNKEKLKNTLLSLASLFETGKVKKMNDITTLYPTGVVRAIGINFGGYMSKCAAPEKFLISDLIKLSQVLNVDVGIILKVVVKEAQQNMEERDISHLLPSQD